MTEARDHAALVEFIESRMRTRFAWGKAANDCCSYAGGAVFAQTGHDPLVDLPNWKTERGAALVLKRLGGLEAAVDARLPAVTTALASRGDIALVELSGRRSLMVVEGDALVGPGEHGNVRLPRAAMLRAWSAVRR